MQKREMAFEDEEVDQFNRLPDAILCFIFNKLKDAKSLCRCISVSKRFASIVPQVDTVSLAVPRKKPGSSKQSHHQLTKSSCNDCRRGSKNVLRSLVRKVIQKPLQFFINVIRLRSSCSISDDADCSYHSPSLVLKNFKEIRFLQIELPGYGGEIESNSGESFLKWRAEFGKELESCVVLGAKSIHGSSQTSSNGEENGDHERQSGDDLMLADDELRLRVVWTISCLMAACARHYMLHQIVSEHQMLQGLSVTDSSKQGRLCMMKEQIEELRSNKNSQEKLQSPPATERTAVPALKVKLWYVAELELPSAGRAMKGATLMLIRPMEAAKKNESDGELVRRFLNREEKEEEKVFGEALGEMMKKKTTCTLEMNSF